MYLKKFLQGRSPKLALKLAFLQKGTKVVWVKQFQLLAALDFLSGSKASAINATMDYFDCTKPEAIAKIYQIIGYPEQAKEHYDLANGVFKKEDFQEPVNHFELPSPASKVYNFGGFLCTCGDERALEILEEIVDSFNTAQLSFDEFKAQSFEMLQVIGQYGSNNLLLAVPGRFELACNTIATEREARTGIKPCVFVENELCWVRENENAEWLARRHSGIMEHDFHLCYMKQSSKTNTFKIRWVHCVKFLPIPF